MSLSLTLRAVVSEGLTKLSAFLDPSFHLSYVKHGGGSVMVSAALQA